MTLWLQQMRTGNAVAASEIWDRYYDRLVQFAGRRMRGNRDHAVDSEDLVHSAFGRFCTVLMSGGYPDLGDRDDLWNLLIVYTLNRVRRHFRASNAQKRRPESAVAHEFTADQALQDLRLPETQAVMSDLLDHWLQRLDAEDSTGELRRIAVMRMDECPADEIARALKRRKTIVLQKIHLIRLIWEQCENS